MAHIKPKKFHTNMTPFRFHSDLNYCKIARDSLPLTYLCPLLSKEEKYKKGAMAVSA
jgi:hypothetical protein